jgi:putative endonuclease
MTLTVDLGSMHQYYVYIMASKTRVIYTGVTNNLERRAYEHKHGLIEGFTKRYRCHRLVYFEVTSDVNSALEREKEIKDWNRKKKVNLIESVNPNWNNLSDGWYGDD